MDIKLIPLKQDDIELVREWRNSNEVAQYMYTENHITKEQQQNWFESVSKRKDCIYWIIEYENKKLGLASITDINLNLQSCYWAFYLGDTSVRGAGIGGKIEFNVLKHVFDEIGLNKLRCEVFVNNDMVIKMHEKFGFRREAYYREHCIKGDVKLDVVGLGLLKSEWNQLKDQLKVKVYGTKNS
jgi:UDP-4-amino-4,6-dideoxy-N-acetyl-beta-L-altrosamine N-acetyltransferase